MGPLPKKAKSSLPMGRKNLRPWISLSSVCEDAARANLQNKII